MYIINEAAIDKVVEQISEIFEQSSKETKDLNQKLCDIIFSDTGLISEDYIRKTISLLPKEVPYLFNESMKMLKSEMKRIAEVLADLWNDDRYVRAAFELND